MAARARHFHDLEAAADLDRYDLPSEGGPPPDTNPARFTLLKPFALTVIVYVPGGKFANR